MSDTLADLRADIDELGRLGVTEEYRVKQLHKIPVARVVDRVQYILKHCTGKRVLHLGCSWPASALHMALEKVATDLHGVDVAVPPIEHGRGVWHVDLDHKPGHIPSMAWDVIVAAEVLEHLANPGNLLWTLRMNYLIPDQTTLLITVPNAHSMVGYKHITGGIENVNCQHVAYYSYWTLRELVTRYGYAIADFCWYGQARNAQPQESEGLIMCVR